MPVFVSNLSRGHGGRVPQTRWVRTLAVGLDWRPDGHTASAVAVTLTVSRARSSPVPEVVACSGIRIMQISNITDAMSMFMYITH